MDESKEKVAETIAADDYFNEIIQFSIADKIIEDGNTLVNM